jgi:hypothetical protein
MPEVAMESFAYISPETNVEYLVVVNVQRRMVGGILEGCPMYWQTEKQYNILLNSVQVNHCFRESEIPEAVSNYENPLTEAQRRAISSRFD